MSRGVVAVEEKGEGTELCYVPRTIFEEREDEAVLGMIDDYDPEWEFILSPGGE